MSEKIMKNKNYYEKNLQQLEFGNFVMKWISFSKSYMYEWEIESLRVETFVRVATNYANLETI